MTERLVDLRCPRCGGEGRTSNEEEETRKMLVDGTTRVCPVCNYTYEWREGMPVAEGEEFAVVEATPAIVVPEPTPAIEAPTLVETPAPRGLEVVTLEDTHVGLSDLSQ